MDEALRKAIDEAGAAIGPSADDDWRIAPLAHADRYRHTAAELADVLGDSEVKVCAEQYERRDQAAETARDAFKRLTGSANAGILFTAAMGAGLLLLGIFSDGFDEGPRRVLFGVLGGLSIVFGGWALWRLKTLRDEDPLSGWYRERAAAEEARLAYFDQLVARARAVGGAPRLALLVLEYGWRYLAESQRAYFDRRRGQHETAARNAARGARAASLVALLCGPLSGFLAALHHARWSALGTLSVAAAALATWYAFREQVNQDRRNAVHYGDTRDKLDRVRATLSRVREQTARDGIEPAAAFLATVAGVLREEHAQWLANKQHHDAVVERLEKELDRLEAERPKPPPKPADKPGPGAQVAPGGPGPGAPPPV